jgi:hypothetical protein
MDTNVEPIFQERLQHRPALGHVACPVHNGAPRRHVKAFAIKPCRATDNLVDVLEIAAIRQCNELARGRIHGFEAIWTEPGACRGE